MRILLTANASYDPPRGGSTRSNLRWIEHLTKAGHACRVVAPASARKLRDEIGTFQPDWVLVSSEDLGHGLLREAHHSAPGRVVYLAHTPQFFPFGPASWNPDAHAAELVARAAGVVAIGHHTANYIGQHLGREAVVIHPPIYGEGPFPNLASSNAGLATMINPCAIKGISIFQALADHFALQDFGYLPGWGTTAANTARLARTGIAKLPACRDIAEFLGHTKVLLAPSLWLEGFGLIVVEAMLHGIPVIASDSGGLVEAKMGTPFVAPVRAIERYDPIFDEHGLPQPVVKPTDLGPWKDALGLLLGDRGEYERVSEESRAAALAFVFGLDAGRMERYLQTLPPGEAVGEARSWTSLSPDKRALLLRRMRGKL